MDLDRIFRQHGFDLVRQKKHRVYKHPDGRTFVTSSTPSDWRTEKNVLGDFSNLTGLDKEELLRPTKPKRQRTRLTPLDPDQPVLLSPPEPVPAAPVVVHYTKADLKRLKRWEKIYALRDAKQTKQKERLELLLRLIDHGVDRYTQRTGVEIPSGELHRVIGRALQREGWDPVTIGVAVGTRQELYVSFRVGRFYLDLVRGKAFIETQWECLGEKIEVLGDIDEEPA